MAIASPQFDNGPAGPRAGRPRWSFNPSRRPAAVSRRAGAFPIRTGRVGGTERGSWFAPDGRAAQPAQWRRPWHGCHRVTIGRRPARGRTRQRTRQRTILRCRDNAVTRRSAAQRVASHNRGIAAATLLACRLCGQSRGSRCLNPPRSHLPMNDAMPLALLPSCRCRRREALR